MTTTLHHRTYICNIASVANIPTPPPSHPPPPVEKRAGYTLMHNQADSAADTPCLPLPPTPLPKLGYPPFFSDDPLTTCRKIVNWRLFLKFPDEIRISPAAHDLISRLMCDVDERLGTHGVQVRGYCLNE